jgi:hypothetical protein
MATLPAKRSVCALTLGLGLAGMLLVGPLAVSAPASASPFGIAADDPGQPSAPDPSLGSAGAQGPDQAAQRPHRRHIDNNPALRR